MNARERAEEAVDALNWGGESTPLQAIKNIIHDALLAHEKQTREGMAQEAGKWLMHRSGCERFCANETCSCGLTEWLAKMKGEK